MNSSVLQRISASQSKRLEELRKDDGFSLLELVTAVGVLLILVIIGLSSYNAVQNNSKHSATNKAVDEVYGKAFATLVDEDASTNPLQVQDEYNNSSKNVRVSVEELGNDRITVRAFLPNGENGDEEFVVTKTTPTVDGSEDTGTNPPGSGGEETTPIIQDTISRLTYVCDTTQTNVDLPISGISSDMTAVLKNKQTGESIMLSNIINGSAKSLYPFSASYNYEKITTTNYLSQVTLEGGVEYELLLDGKFDSLVGVSTVTANNCLTSVDKLGKDIGLKRMGWFSGTKLQNVPAEIPTTVEDLKFLFKDNSAFNDPDISQWNVSNVKSFDYAFLNTTVFDQDLSKWNVSDATTMRNMFQYARAFDNGGKSLSWGDKTSNVEDMTSMFSAAESFNQNVSGWDVSNVANMDNMFAGAKAFNNSGQPLQWNWGSKSINRSMTSMFHSATSFNQPLNSWEVSNVTNMNYMFYNATSFNQNLSSWKVSKIAVKPGYFNNNAPFASNSSFQPQWGKS